MMTDLIQTARERLTFDENSIEHTTVKPIVDALLKVAEAAERWGRANISDDRAECEGLFQAMCEFEKAVRGE